MWPERAQDLPGNVADSVPEHWNYEFGVIGEYFWVHRNKVLNNVNHLPVFNIVTKKID